MDKLNLPNALVAFLEKGRKFEYSADECEAGLTEFYELSELETQLFPMETGSLENCDEDPNRPEMNSYLVPGVDLISYCTGGYDPTGLLIWFPSEGRFGTWDSSHCVIALFHPNVTWDVIRKSPAAHIDAQWIGMNPKSPPTELLVPWPNYKYADRQYYGPLDSQNPLPDFLIPNDSRREPLTLPTAQENQVFALQEHGSYGNCSFLKHGPFSLVFGEGRSLTSTVKQIECDFGLTRIPPKLDFFKVGSVPYVSGRLKKLLQASGAQAEYFYAGTKRDRSVFAINCMSGKRCVDKDSCTWEKDSVSGRNKIIEFALNKNKIPEQPLFKPRHISFRHLCVSGALKQILENNSMILQFEPVRVVDVA